MRRVFVRLLAVVGGLTILSLILLVAIGLIAGASRRRVPSKAILEVNLETGLVEDVPEDTFAKTMLSSAPTVRDVVDALDRASNDERVAGMIARFGGSSMGLAQVQEIRDAVRNFRAHKKFAVAWSETFGEFGPGAGSYYLATAFDEIWLQPSGDIGLTGVMVQSQFLRGTLDKLGVVPRMDHRYEYKNAMNTFTERKFTPPHREAMAAPGRVLVLGQIVRGIAEGRKLSARRSHRAHRSRSLPRPGGAQQPPRRRPRLSRRRLRQGQGARRTRRQAPLSRTTTSIAPDARTRAASPSPSSTASALSSAARAVSAPCSVATTMGSDTVTAAFRAAVDDSDGQGHRLPRRQPRRFLRRLRRHLARNRARPQSRQARHRLHGRPRRLGRLLRRHGRRQDRRPARHHHRLDRRARRQDAHHRLLAEARHHLRRSPPGANATIWSSTNDYTPAEWARFQAWLDRVYSDFTSKVAEGRRLPRERVLEIAKGRIWTGEDARNLGLVDELGGYPAALRLAKLAAKIPESEDVNLRVFPRKKSTLEALAAQIGGEQPESSERDAAQTALIDALRLVQPFARQVRSVTAGVETLEMPEFASRP